MKIEFLSVRAVCAVVATICISQCARAESSYLIFSDFLGSGSGSTSARADFSIAIPRFVFLRVGTGTLLSNNSTVDTIVFQPALAQVGTGSPISATGASGDLGNGTVTVRVIGNVGNVTLRSVSSPALLTNSVNGATIPWSQLLVTAVNIAHPTINGANSVFAATNNVVNLAGQWTYRYANTITPVPGTYQSTVTYTASTP